MVDTYIHIHLSNFADYELNQVENHITDYNETIQKIIKEIKRDPNEMIELKKFGTHPLLKKENETLEYFSDFNEFVSSYVDEKGGWRFVWKPIYKSVKKGKERELVYDNVYDSYLPDDTKNDIWESIDKHEKNCTEKFFVFVYVANVCFNYHKNLNPNLASFSIDYLLYKKGVKIDPYSPFMDTQYSILKYDEYEKELKEKRKNSDSFLYGLIDIYNSEKQAIMDENQNTDETI